MTGGVRLHISDSAIFRRVVCFWKSGYRSVTVKWGVGAFEGGGGEVVGGGVLLGG